MLNKTQQQPPQLIKNTTPARAKSTGLLILTFNEFCRISDLIIKMNSFSEVLYYSEKKAQVTWSLMSHRGLKRPVGRYLFLPAVSPSMLYRCSQGKSLNHGAITCWHKSDLKEQWGKTWNDLCEKRQGYKCLVTFTGLAPSGVDNLRTVCVFYWVQYLCPQATTLITVLCLQIMLKSLRRRKVTHLWSKSVYNPTEKLENVKSESKYSFWMSLRKYRNPSGKTQQ